MDVNDLSKQLIGYCIKIHKQLGVGLFESIYEEALSYELNKNEISFQRQIEIPVIYENKQLLTYLKITGIQLGLLINFNEILLKDGITRIKN